ncbi:MAG: phosphatase [Pseudanabaena frigida]|uniref:Phosphatase n=1 Tax=Pseudanabaena frigida TaxID=945775 RepID=A0A2W4WGX9_9CYAN|nr:MAG: phosphatase [Pseudanabaena frigida]
MEQNSNRPNNYLAEIYNFLPISEHLATSGQPSIEQLQSIADSGYEVVINLALPTSDGAISNEVEIVQSLGMEYIAIPVIWENPTKSDLDRFLQAIDKRKSQKIFVHCAKNMRVSAFVYLYRRLSLNCEDEAIADLHKIWQPNEIWQKFIDSNDKKLTA